MSKKRIVVIGASAGGVEALRETVAGFPKDFPAAVFVVLHIPPYQASNLPDILTRSGPLRATHAADGEKIEVGHIYVAPPDHHLLINDGSMVVARGPKENRFRPSIDALFRSAAYTYGSSAIGVVLSGALDDGTSGLWSIKRLGGLAIVQRLDDAKYESMPKSALKEVNVDFTLPAAEIGPLVSKLVSEERSMDAPNVEEDRKRMKTEIDIAIEDAAFQKNIMNIGELTPFTCPECHGVLVKIPEQRMPRFRCHTGHAYTINSLLEGVMEATGEMLWQVMRSYEEAVMVVEHMAQHLDEGGEKADAKVFFAKAKELEVRSKKLHDIVLQHESLSGDNLGAAGKPSR